MAQRFLFGDAAEKLGHSAWWTGNSDGTTHPVAQKKAEPVGVVRHARGRERTAPGLVRQGVLRQLTGC
jgi:hypothetical protein